MRAASLPCWRSLARTRQQGNKQYALPAEQGGKPAPQLTQPGLGRRLLTGCCDDAVDPLLSLAVALWGIEKCSNV